MSKSIYSQTLGIVRSFEFNYLIIVLFDLNGILQKAYQVEKLKIENFVKKNKYEQGKKFTTTKRFLEICDDITIEFKKKNKLD
jgi:hypothetical protein